MTNQIKVLFLAANPGETTKLQLDEEARAIAEAIQHGRDRDSLAFETAWAVRTSDLQRVILNHKPQILHFSGHGSQSPGLTMGNENGDMLPVSGEAVAAIVKAAAPPIRMVVLNACLSLQVTRRFRNAVDYTIGMNQPISDSSAIWFSAAFYGALAAGTTVEKAFEWSIARLLTQGSSEARTPRLLKRRGLRTPAVLLPALEPEPIPEPERHPADASLTPAPNYGTTVTAGKVRDIKTFIGDNTTYYGSPKR
jgi:hypothetical protein